MCSVEQALNHRHIPHSGRLAARGEAACRRVSPNACVKCPNRASTHQAPLSNVERQMVQLSPRVEEREVFAAAFRWEQSPPPAQLGALEFAIDMAQHLLTLLNRCDECGFDSFDCRALVTGTVQTVGAGVRRHGNTDKVEQIKQHARLDLNAETCTEHEKRVSAAWLDEHGAGMVVVMVVVSLPGKE